MLPKFTKHIHFGWWVVATLLFIGVSGFVVPRMLATAGDTSQLYFDTRNALALEEPQLAYLQQSFASASIPWSIVLSLDVVFPLVYNFYFFTSLVLVLRKQNHPQLKYLLWLPLLTLVADLAQQVAIQLYLRQMNASTLVLWIPYLTQLKWMCIYGTFAVLAVAFGYRFMALQKERLFGEAN